MANEVEIATQEDQAAREGEKFYIASQWNLMWWKFRKHKVAVFCSFVILFLYLIAAFCEFIAPYDLHERHVKFVFTPPQKIHFVHEGKLRRPFVYGLEREVDLETLRKIYHEDTSQIFPLRLFVRGNPYQFWNLFETDLHLFGIGNEDGTAFLLGTDRLGRDVLSRVIYGARISLSIGLVGVFLALVLGMALGGASGYYGGSTDNIIQRLIELLRSFPTIPLWMALSAALPPEWPPLRIYFGITVILSLIGWTGLARVVRGKLLSLREEDFATAARLAGASETRVIGRHLLPGFMSHIIVTITLAIPGMILAETALSFLGGAAPAGDQLGRAAAGGAERAHGGAASVADAARAVRDRGRARLQLRRRRPARRGRPLLPLALRGA